MNVQMKTQEVLNQFQQKYSDQDVNSIVQKKYSKWQKNLEAKIDYFGKQEREFLSYKEAVRKFSDAKLPIDPVLLELIVCEDIQKTQKYVQAIIQFAFKIDSFRS